MLIPLQRLQSPLCRTAPCARQMAGGSDANTSGGTVLLFCSGGKSWRSAAEASTRRRSPSRAGCSCGAAGKWVLARLEHIAQSRLTHRCCVSASAIGAVERLCSLPVWRGPRGRYFGQLGHGDTLDRKSPKQLRESGRTSRAAVWHTTPNHTTPHHTCVRTRTHARTNPRARVHVVSTAAR